MLDQLHEHLKKNFDSYLEIYEQVSQDPERRHFLAKQLEIIKDTCEIYLIHENYRNKKYKDCLSILYNMINELENVEKMLSFDREVLKKMERKDD